MRRTLAELFELLVDDEAPVAFVAYDGSVRRCEGALGTVEVRSPRALRYLVTAPGELGVARAYVTGEIEIAGDLHATLHALAAHGRRPVPWAELLPAIRRWMLRRPPLPVEEASAPWHRGALRHSKARDARAISHHYDLSNRFYELLLGPTMAYSCAVFARPDATLEEAQREKFDLVCRKLGLEPGQRLLDVGAGWGGLVRHAAQHYGVRAVGVTLSRQQAGWAQRAILDAGLQGRAQVRFLDYRDVGEREFDAISSVGAMEHIGCAKLRSHFRAIAACLRPEGRMLNHTITRPSNHQHHRAGPLIDRYVFPDAELESPGTVLGAMHDEGLEIRHEENLREHYAATLRAWGANLERSWSRAVGEVGERRARVWRLYLAMSRVGFDLNRLQIHQMLGVRVGADGSSGNPPRPAWRRDVASRISAPPAAPIGARSRRVPDAAARGSA